MEFENKVNYLIWLFDGTWLRNLTENRYVPAKLSDRSASQRSPRAREVPTPSLGPSFLSADHWPLPSPLSFFL